MAAKWLKTEIKTVFLIINRRWQKVHIQQSQTNSCLKMRGCQPCYFLTAANLICNSFFTVQQKLHLNLVTPILFRCWDKNLKKKDNYVHLDGQQNIFKIQTQTCHLPHLFQIVRFSITSRRGQEFTLSFPKRLGQPRLDKRKGLRIFF